MRQPAQNSWWFGCQIGESDKHSSIDNLYMKSIRILWYTDRQTECMYDINVVLFETHQYPLTINLCLIVAEIWPLLLPLSWLSLFFFVLSWVLLFIAKKVELVL